MTNEQVRNIYLLGGPHDGEVRAMVKPGVQHIRLAEYQEPAWDAPTLSRVETATHWYVRIDGVHRGAQVFIYAGHAATPDMPQRLAKRHDYVGANDVPDPVRRYLIYRLTEELIAAGADRRTIGWRTDVEPIPSTHESHVSVRVTGYAPAPYEQPQRRTS